MDNIREIVRSVQSKLDENKATCDKIFLSYKETGYVESVELNIWTNDITIDSPIWDSENDQRRYIEATDEYEDFEKFLIRTVEDSIASYKILKHCLVFNPDEEDLEVQTLDMLHECRAQLDFLNEKQSRGTTTAVLSRLDALLQKLSK